MKCKCDEGRKYMVQSKGGVGSRGGEKCTRQDTISVPLLNKIDCGDVFYKTLFDEMLFPVAFVEVSELDGEQKCDELVQ